MAIPKIISLEVSLGGLELLQHLTETRRAGSIVEYIRRCVDLEQELFKDPDAVVTVKDQDGERTFKLPYFHGKTAVT